MTRLLPLLACLFAPAAVAATLEVPGTFATLAQALEVANSLDVIEIDPYSYDPALDAGGVRVEGLSLDIVSADATAYAAVPGLVLDDGAVVTLERVSTTGDTVSTSLASGLVVGIAVLDGSKVVVRSGLISVPDGYGIVVIDSTLTLYNTELTGHTAGSGLLAFRSEVTLSELDSLEGRCFMHDNNAAGALISVAGDLQVTDCDFADNAVQDGATLLDVVFDALGYETTAGGDIWLVGTDSAPATGAVNGGSFSSSSSQGYAGSIGVINGQLEVLGTEDEPLVFSGHSADRGGVFAAYARDSTTQLLIQDIEIDGATSITAGGAIYATGDALVEVGRVTVTDTSTLGDGGVVYLVDGATLAMTGAELTGPASSSAVPQFGGAIAAYTDSTVTLDETDITGFVAEQSGGALYVDGGSLTVTETTFTGNDADAGAVAYVKDASLSLSGIDVRDNTAGYGAGIYGRELADYQITQGWFCANEAGAQGAALDLELQYAALGSLENLAILGNRTSSGGAVELRGDGVHTVAQLDLLDNEGTAGQLVLSDGAFDIVNNLFMGGEWGITASSAPSSLTGGYNLYYQQQTAPVGPQIADLPGEGAVVDEDPVLDGYTGDCDGDLALGLGSPAHDAGDPEREDPDGSRSDIGYTGGPDADWSSPAYEDGDGDGWVKALDCDDDDADISPSAEEIPFDGIDQNCDGDDGDMRLRGGGCLMSQGSGAGLLLLVGLGWRRRR